jgi:hypothetical protein
VSYEEEDTCVPSPSHSAAYVYVRLHIFTKMRTPQQPRFANIMTRIIKNQHTYMGSECYEAET